MKSPLPNNSNPKSEKDTNVAIVNTLLPRINLEYEFRSSLTSYYRW
jgi:hypothetical protein